MHRPQISRASALALTALAATALVYGCKPGASASNAAGGLMQPASASAPGAMTTFTDPTENAFTISAPAGWTTKGGIQRASATAATPWITTASPDGATTISVGDPSIPPFTLPSAQHAAGTTLQNAAGATSSVAPYETGAQFAADYAQRAFGPTCAPLQPAGSQAEPTLAQTAQADLATMAAAVGVPAPPSVFDGGSALFTCQVAGAPYEVGVIDVTALNQSSVGGFWSVPVLIAYRTPLASQAQTDQVARAMRASFQRNPQWEAQMVAATRQQLAVIQQQGAAAMGALTRQEAQESGMLNAQMQSANARLNAAHAATMNQLNAQGAARNAAWNQQMYNKDTSQQSEMRYIQNQTCIRWYDAAHTRCAATASN